MPAAARAEALRVAAELRAEAAAKAPAGVPEARELHAALGARRGTSGRKAHGIRFKKGFRKGRDVFLCGLGDEEAVDERVAWKG